MRSVEPAELEALSTAAAMGGLPVHGTVSVTGPDASTFLQSLVSADLDGIDVGHGARSLLLTPQGKLGLRFAVLRVSESDWLCVIEGPAAELVSQLSRFKIRVDVDIEDATAGFDRIDVRGPRAIEIVSSVGDIVPDHDLEHCVVGELRLLRDDWGTSTGVALLGTAEHLDSARARLRAAGAVDVGPAAMELARIEAGIPRLGNELDERTIPQEAFLDVDHVSFDKGCFLGQELVCRIDTRGRVNRLLRRIELDGAVSEGDPIEVDGSSVGEVTSVVGRPDGVVSALGYAHRDVEVPSDASVRSGARIVAARLLAIG